MLCCSRTRRLRRRGLSRAERAELPNFIGAWNQNSGGSGAQCSFTPGLTLPATALLLLVAGCAHDERVNPIQGTCAIGAPCTVTGDMSIYRGSPASVAEIRTSRRCFAAALDDHVYRAHRRWSGRRVQVSGTLFEQPSGGSVISYELNGRPVAAGVCPSGPVIFVESIRRIESR
jgi:hypothetical protein